MTSRSATTVETGRRSTAPALRRARPPSRPPSTDCPLWTVVDDSTPDGVDLDRPNAARMHDFYLGGAHNFSVDRQAAQAIDAAAPQVIDAARANRHFQRRAVRHALSEGVRQFLDLGSGFPTHGSVHHIVHAAHRAAPVVHVDADLVAVAFARQVLDANPAAEVVRADIRDIAAILDHPDVQRLIDLTQPVCVLLVSVLDFVPGDLTHAMSTLRARLSPGSLLVLSHGSDPEPRYAAQFEAVRQVYAQTDTPVCSRTPEQIAALCAGFDLVTPHADADIAGPSGLVAVNQWRPDETTSAAGDHDDPFDPLGGLLVAVARKPHRRPPPAPTNLIP